MCEVHRLQRSDVAAPVPSGAAEGAQAHRREIRVSQADHRAFGKLLRFLFGAKVAAFDQGHPCRSADEFARNRDPRRTRADDYDVTFDDLFVA